VGGDFTRIGNTPLSYLGMIVGPNGSSWVPAPSHPVLALAKIGSTLYAGGAFTTICGSTLHPYFAGISDGTVTGVATEPTTAAPTVLAAHPNPFHRDTTVRFTLPRAEPVHAVVYDAAGRQVRDLQNGNMSAGEHEISWSGLDQSGHGAAKGVYFLRVEAASLHRSAKVLLLR
jgi:flagellar hook capping protein FlgD